MTQHQHTDALAYHLRSSVFLAAVLALGFAAMAPSCQDDAPLRLPPMAHATMSGEGSGPTAASAVDATRHITPALDLPDAGRDVDGGTPRIPPTPHAPDPMGDAGHL